MPTAGHAAGGRRVTEPRDRLFQLAAAPDVEAALELADELLESGLGPERIISEVVVPTQVRVGNLWATDVWSVAQEHAATAVVDAVVGRLALVRGRPAGSAGRVAVVCAEGEWHTLAARLVSVALRAQGWSVVFLGGSVPAAHLARSARSGGWDAAVLTCSVAMFLPGARRSVAALHECGVPVLATARGFGTDALRAERIGADAWAAGPEDGLRILGGWMTDPPARLAVATVPDEAEAFELALPELTERVRAIVSQRWGEPRDLSGSGDVRDDVRTLLRFVHAAVVTGDERIVTEYLGWLHEVVVSRDLPAATVEDLLDAARTAVPDELPRTRRQLQEIG